MFFPKHCLAPGSKACLFVRKINGSKKMDNKQQAEDKPLQLNTALLIHTPSKIELL